MFVFSLIHGGGLANVLSNLGLPRKNFLAALLAVNVGVELGQLAIVAAALPVIALARGTSLIECWRPPPISRRRPPSGVTG